MSTLPPFHPVTAFLRAAINGGVATGADVGWAVRLLCLGRDFPVIAHWAGPYGPAHECFANARRYVQRRRGLRYCEGLVSHMWMPPGMEREKPWIVAHGWAVDAEDRVWDPTLPPHFTDRRYWGIIL
jgi:hypothetical protein